MKREFNRIKIFANNNARSEEIRDKLESELLKNNFDIVDNDFDLAIAVGGDGSFLRMIKACNFNSNISYIGINAGTLGFAQEIRFENYQDFVKKLNNNEFTSESVGVQETVIRHGKSTSYFYSLNEFVVRDGNFDTICFKIEVNNKILENFAGDGILISTSFGSTAYNLSFGGSIVFNELHTLQITPIAPLNNKAYCCLRNSVIIPENRIIKITPKDFKKTLLVTIDGENNFYEDVISIETCIKDKRIKCLREFDYDFSSKINEKFLK